MIKVRSVMTREVVTIEKSAGIMQAAELMNSKSVSCLVVIENKMPIAIVSEKDIIRAINSGKKKITDVMDSSMLIVSPITRFSEILKNLHEKKIRRFPVVENNELIGLITETDIVNVIRNFTKLHQLILEIILAIFGLATAFFLFYFSPLGVKIFG